MAHANLQAPPACDAIVAAPESPVWDAPPKYLRKNFEGFEDVPLGTVSEDRTEQGSRLPRYSKVDPVRARRRKVLLMASVGGFLVTLLLGLEVLGMMAVRAKAEVKVPGQVDSFPPAASSSVAIDG